MHLVDSILQDGVYGETCADYNNYCLPADLVNSLSPSSSLQDNADGVGAVVMNDMGDVAVVVNSLYGQFGSYALSEDGFFYNNFAMAFDSQSSTNAMEPEKRPMSTLAPVIAFKPDNLCKQHIASSSSGTIASVAASSQVLRAILDGGQGIEEANSHGRVYASSVSENAATEAPDEGYESKSSWFDALKGSL